MANQTTSFRWLIDWMDPPPPPWKKPSALMLLYHVPLLFQSALLHPKFAASGFLRSIRLALVPLNCWLGFKIMFDFCFTPITQRGPFNLALACWGCHLVMKVLEWGLSPSKSDGTYRIRLEFRNRKHVSMDTSPKTSSLGEVSVWTIDQMISSRGLKYGWGWKVSPNDSGVLRVIWRLILTNLVQLFGLAVCVLVRDAGSPLKAAVALGIPTFPGINIIAEGIATLGFGLLIIAGFEHVFCYLCLFAHLVDWIDSYHKLPYWFTGFFDPKLFLPLFNAPHMATSLAWLWGKGWHQIYRRSFLFCGAFPASALVKRLGLGLKAQRVCGLFGSFLVSGILHEIAIRCVARPTHPWPHIHFESFPASLAYFLLQPVGIIIEPYIIPVIPKSLGGGWLWVLVFTLTTATPFRMQYVNFRIVDDLYLPFAEWSLSCIVFSTKLMRW